jgi:CheY-like chemotaxis protein
VELFAGPHLSDNSTMRGPSDCEAWHDLGAHRLLGIVRQDDAVVACRAVHRGLGEARIVKVLLPGALPGAAARRFVRQARSLAALPHPGLQATFDSDRLPSGAAFVALEPVHGEPADEWLRRAGGLAGRPAVGAAIVATVAEACAHLAQQSIIHGDLRSGNLLLVPAAASAGRFTIKLVGSEEAALRCSPGAANVGSEIQALGRLFIELLTGAPPAVEVAPSASSVAGIGVELQRLIGRMLARAPEHRYQSMEEIVTAIELILGRHRSRFPELLTSPGAPVLASAPAACSSDLTPLAFALTGDASDEWISGALGRLRGAGAAAREAITRRLASLRPRHTATPGGPTILVAEDDDDTRQSLVELLEERGYRVIAARHGREAQEYLLKGERTECMLMDLWMPEMDGWRLAEEMREGRVPSVPTIVMTAAEPHWGYPCSVVVRKPFDSDHLLDLVETISGGPPQLQPPPESPTPGPSQ